MIEAIVLTTPFYGYTTNENGVVMNPRNVVNFKEKGLEVKIDVAQIYPNIWCGDIHVTRSGEGRYYGCGGPITVRDKQADLRTTINNLLWKVHSYLERNEDKVLADRFIEKVCDKYEKH